MPAILDTRRSLLIRLRDRDDEAAWSEFLAVYEPVIYGLARRRGFQDADAREVTQEVLLSVSQAIDRFDPSSGGSFRGWLSRITRNIAIDRLRRGSDVVVGRTEINRLLADMASDPSEAEAAEFEQSRQRQLFLWASGQVRSRFSEVNWNAFWLTSVEGQATESVAEQLGISVGAVYVARCRILSRLREIVQQRSVE